MVFLSKVRKMLVRPRFYIFSIIALCVVILAIGVISLFALRGSVPHYFGIVELSGLEYGVTVERDHLGIPTITADNRVDLARALGFTHAQERFFQMDLLRRSSAGELSELFGEIAINVDKKKRIHQSRSVAQESVAMLSQDERDFLIAYTEGVNQGISIIVRPWEYFLLRKTPAEWLLEDSLLVGLAMFYELEDPQGINDLTRGYMKRMLPEALYDFMIHNGSSWTAAIDDSEIPLRPLSDSIDFTYCAETVGEQDPTLVFHDPHMTGSNSWALSGEYTEEGYGALVACDMHLSLRVPSIWYRASFRYRDYDGEDVLLDGITLPGVPVMILGSNRHIAWGITSGKTNTTDVVLIEETRPGYYSTPDGEHAFEEVVEMISVAGKEPVPFTFLKTIWGPVIDEDFFGQKVALQWLGHDPRCINLQMWLFEHIKTAQEALDAAYSIGTPSLNLVVGDADGNIGWTLLGYIPEHVGYGGDLPTSFASGDARWVGPLPKERRPSLHNPPSGKILTANNRIMGNQWLDLFGDGGYLNGIRAYQIKHRLEGIERVTPQEMLSIQLDDEALFYRRWQKLLLEVLRQERCQFDPLKKEMREIIVAWDGYASVDSVAFTLIKSFRESLSHSLVERIFQPCMERWDQFNPERFDYEEPIWIILQERPPTLRDPSYESWDAEFASHVDRFLQLYGDDGDIDWESCQWGKWNALAIHHPLSRAVPVLGYFLDFVGDSISGDAFTPKMVKPDKGASQRMVVIPGHEEESIFHHPCGQSGHPLSRYYRTSHEDWLQGNPSPLLPGETERMLMLQPAM